MATTTDTPNDERKLSGKRFAREVITTIGMAGLIGAGMILYSLLLIVVYEVLVSAGVPMEQPSTMLLILRFPFDLSALIGLVLAAAWVVKRAGGGFPARKSVLFASALYTTVWACLLALGVETAWVV